MDWDDVEVQKKSKKEQGQFPAILTEQVSSKDYAKTHSRIQPYNKAY